MNIITFARGSWPQVGITEVYVPNIVYTHTNKND